MNENPKRLAALGDEALLEAVQRQTFRYFWDAAHPVSGLARDRVTRNGVPGGDLIAVGGSGYGIMSMLVAAERGWVSRGAALERLAAMLELLTHSACYHGAMPHFMDGRTGATLPFMRKDDGGDLVETSFLIMGLLCARAYFDGSTALESKVRNLITGLWSDVEWDWYTRDHRQVLTWHWSPNNGWALDLDIRGWNECLITYLLAVAAPRYGVDPAVYHRGFAIGQNFINGNDYFGIKLPLGPPAGGPLYFAHYSFAGIDPRGLADRYADYREQCVNHVRINHAYCAANESGHAGYGPDSWGLTSSDDVEGYALHAPGADTGTLAPTAAISSMPYAPREALNAIRHFLTCHGDKVWDQYGFVDAFCPDRNWYADTFLAVDQGPMIVMIENHRSGLLWKLFMSIPEIQGAFRALGFTSPQVPATGPDRRR